jgi:molybdopterin converting factor small subunit
VYEKTYHVRYDGTMVVHVKLFSRFRDHLPRESRGEATVDLPDGATVQTLITHLGITRRVKLITVNGERETDTDRVLSEGDGVRIFPVVVGG